VGDQYRWWSSSWCSSLHSPVTTSLLAPIFPSAPRSQAPTIYVPPYAVWTVDCFVIGTVRVFWEVGSERLIDISHCCV
jgi:hypothetical protein